ncbi:MAG TPA: glycosyltransferase family 2 protein, partial [Bacteroidales bacterium]|nr:glycosyltransferase family 2 protein [Bacteroidales bacterium]
MTMACLHSVYEETRGISFEVIVVDNDSKDGSAQSIKKKFPAVKLIVSDKNLGFGRANNLATKIAKGNYLLLLNPDTIVLNGAIQKLYSFACRNPNNRIYGGRTLYSDLTLNPTSCWRRPTLWSLFCYSVGLTKIFKGNSIFDPESYGHWKRDSVRLVDIVTGCLLMIERKLWDQLNGFDNVFFMYGEEADLCIRSAKFGASPIITPDATIIHHDGASEKIYADKMIRILRAKKQFIKKHWNQVGMLIGFSLLLYSVLVRMVASHTNDLLS